MMDAYTHLDMTSPDPIADFKSCMASAGVNRAIVIETWKGDNYSSLVGLITSQPQEFRVVPCFRPDQDLPTMDLLHQPTVAGLRAKTADIHRLGRLAAWLESSQKWLVPHAEQGIKALADELLALTGDYPALRVYLPHCGWPRQNQEDDGDWRKCVTELSAHPNMIVGISAIKHFSSEPFPHQDVQGFAEQLIEKFGADSVVAASDYPMFEKTQYVDYIKLAEVWIKLKHPYWAPLFESLVFG